MQLYELATSPQKAGGNVALCRGAFKVESGQAVTGKRAQRWQRQPLH